LRGYPIRHNGYRPSLVTNELSTQLLGSVQGCRPLNGLWDQPGFSSWTYWLAARYAPRCRRGKVSYDSNVLRFKLFIHNIWTKGSGEISTQDCSYISFDTQYCETFLCSTTATVWFTWSW